MLLQLTGCEFQCVYLWVGYEELSVPCSIHQGRERCPVSLLFVRTNTVVIFCTLFSCVPLGFILFAFCSSLFQCYSLLSIYLVFSIIFLTARTIFPEQCKLHSCKDCWSMICFIICDIQYDPEPTIFHTNFIPGCSEALWSTQLKYSLNYKL